MDCLLLGTGHWKTRTLCRKVGTLHWELGTLILKLRARALHQQTTQKWVPDKLTRLQKMEPSVISGMLAWKNHLVLAILLHLLQLVHNDDGLIN
jgi:uncharacterized protein (DUF2062 family)